MQFLKQKGLQKMRDDRNYKYILKLDNINMRSEYFQVRKTKKMGRGLFAKKDIPANSNIMTIEERKFITYQKVREHAILSRIQEDVACKISCFAYYLAYCEAVVEPTQEELEIKEYIKELPQYFHNLICWKEDELNLLENNQLIKRSKQKISYFFHKYLEIQEALVTLTKKDSIDVASVVLMPQSRRTTRKRVNYSIKQKEMISKIQLQALKQVSFDQALKFIAVIKSRNIYWANQFDRDSEVGALIPNLELFNHSEKSQCRVNQGFQCEKVFTITDIKKGEEIYVKYGENFTMEHMLEDYGMLPELECILDEGGSGENKQNSKANVDPEASYQNGNKFSHIHEERIMLASRYNALMRAQRQAASCKLPFSHRN